MIVERCLKKFIYKSWPPVMRKDAWNIHSNFKPASHNGLTMAMLQSTHESVMHISTLMFLNLSTGLGLIGIAKCYVTPHGKYSGMLRGPFQVRLVIFIAFHYYYCYYGTCTIACFVIEREL